MTQGKTEPSASFFLFIGVSNSLAQCQPQKRVKTHDGRKRSKPINFARCSTDWTKLIGQVMP